MNNNFCHSIPEPDESLRGGYMLFFVDDGEGMDPSKLKATMFKLVYRYMITTVDHSDILLISFRYDNRFVIFRLLCKTYQQQCTVLFFGGKILNRLSF